MEYSPSDHRGSHMFSRDTELQPRPYGVEGLRQIRRRHRERMDYIHANWTEVEISHNLVLFLDEIRSLDQAADPAVIAQALDARLESVARACLPRIEADHPDGAVALRGVVRAAEAVVAELHRYDLSHDGVRQLIDTAQFEAMLLIPGS
jgi:hypothetical protein